MNLIERSLQDVTARAVDRDGHQRLRAPGGQVMRALIRQWWLGLKYHPWLNRIRDERESRAFMKKHGGVKSVEDMRRDT